MGFLCQGITRVITVHPEGNMNMECPSRNCRYCTHLLGFKEEPINKGITALTSIVASLCVPISRYYFIFHAKITYVLSDNPGVGLLRFHTTNETHQSPHGSRPRPPEKVV